jgi:F-type H+-transporting ATPase subunit b
MRETLHQLGRLLLGSVPTIFFVVLLYWIYTVLLYRPLVRALAERRSRTEGAMEKARADVLAAAARTADYEQRLREARLAVFQAQEARLQAALETRAAALAEARARAKVQLEQAVGAIAQDKVAAQAGLDAQGAVLAEEIIGAVLRPAAGGSR